MKDRGIEYARAESTDALRFQLQERTFVVVHMLKARYQIVKSKSSCRSHPSPLV